MDYEKEIKELKRQVELLQIAFCNAQRNNISTVERVDDTANKVSSLTAEIEETDV